jgi:hypothetical protein
MGLTDPSACASLCCSVALPFWLTAALPHYRSVELLLLCRLAEEMGGIVEKAGRKINFFPGTARY